MMLSWKSVTFLMDLEKRVRKIAKEKNALSATIVGILVLSTFLIPSFYALVIYLSVALFVDVTFKAKSRIFTSLLLPILSSALAFVAHKIDLDFTSKTLQACTLIALTTLLLSNNKIFFFNPKTL